MLQKLKNCNRFFNSCVKGSVKQTKRFVKMDKYIVKKPFFGMEPGDILEYEEKNNTYTNVKVSKNTWEDEGNERHFEYSSSIAFDPDTVEELENDGLIYKENAKSQRRVNIFDEIDNLAATYEDDLKNVDEDMCHMPECLKVERVTVLENMLKLLNHLKSLKR